jgi:hypothetical protein
VNGNVKLTVDFGFLKGCKFSVDGSFLADFLKRVKYAYHTFFMCAGSLGGLDNHTPSTMEMDYGARRTAGFLATVASYNATVRMALSHFFY